MKNRRMPSGRPVREKPPMSTRWRRMRPTAAPLPSLSCSINRKPPLQSAKHNRTGPASTARRDAYPPEGRLQQPRRTCQVEYVGRKQGGPASNCRRRRRNTSRRTPDSTKNRDCLYEPTTPPRARNRLRATSTGRTRILAPRTSSSYATNSRKVSPADPCVRGQATTRPGSSRTHRATWTILHCCPLRTLPLDRKVLPYPPLVPGAVVVGEISVAESVQGEERHRRRDAPVAVGNYGLVSVLRHPGLA